MNDVAYFSAVSGAIPDGVCSQEDILALEISRPDPLGSVTSTYNLLGQGAAISPDAPALSFFLRPEDFTRPHVWSHRESFARITQAANLFRTLGVQRGDVIAFILPNLPETHWTIWGGEAAGVIFAINPLLEPLMMAELMNAAKPKILVTLAPTPGADLWHKATEAAKQVSTLQHILTVTPLTYLRTPLAPFLKFASQLCTPGRVGRAWVSSLRKLMDTMPADRLEFKEPGLDDIASYFCTGGTTGSPKIAVRTHRTEVANAIELNAALGSGVFAAGRSVFCGLPLFHVNAQIATGLTPWSAGAQVILGTPQGYRATGLLQRFWDIAEHYRFQFFSGVPTVFSALLQNPPLAQDLSALKYGVCGAAPMAVELINQFQQKTGVKILEGYGLTEGGCASSLNPVKGETRAGSIGLRLPWQGMRVVILDADGHFVRNAAIDEQGVIVIQGPNLFQGYLNPAHNEGLWILIPDTGWNTTRWLNTGDLGRQDRDGYFWLTGRKKELIIRGGHNIDPKMIEEAMHSHPAVALAAAVGRPDLHSGEVPVLYVQLRPNQTASEDMLMHHAKEHIAERAAWPKLVRVLTALPTTGVGKLFKPALTLLELESVVRNEAQESGTTLMHCKAEQDPRLGMMIRWKAQGDATRLRSRLAMYAFRNLEE